MRARHGRGGPRSAVTGREKPAPIYGLWRRRGLGHPRGSLRPPLGTAGQPRGSTPSPPSLERARLKVAENDSPWAVSGTEARLTWGWGSTPPAGPPPGGQRGQRPKRGPTARWPLRAGPASHSVKSPGGGREKGEPSPRRAKSRENEGAQAWGVVPPQLLGKTGGPASAPEEPRQRALTLTAPSPLGPPSLAPRDQPVPQGTSRLCGLLLPAELRAEARTHATRGTSHAPRTKPRPSRHTGKGQAFPAPRCPAATPETAVTGGQRFRHGFHGTGPASEVVRVALSKLFQDLGDHGGNSTLGYAGPAGPRGGAVTWSPASHWPPGSAEPGVPRARSHVAATIPPDSSLSCSELSFVMHVPRQPPRVLGAVVVGGADQWITEPTLLWKSQRICVGAAHLVSQRGVC